MSPAVPAAKKRAVVEALFARGGRPHPDPREAAALLAERDRLALLPELAAAFERRLMDHRQVVRAELSTAVELPADRVDALRAGLAQATGRDVQIETRVDPCAHRRRGRADRQHRLRRQRHAQLREVEAGADESAQ